MVDRSRYPRRADTKVGDFTTSFFLSPYSFNILNSHTYDGLRLLGSRLKEGKPRNKLQSQPDNLGQMPMALPAQGTGPKQKNIF